MPTRSYEQINDCIRSWIWTHCKTVCPREDTSCWGLVTVVAQAQLIGHLLPEVTSGKMAVFPSPTPKASHPEATAPLTSKFICVSCSEASSWCCCRRLPFQSNPFPVVQLSSDTELQEAAAPLWLWYNIVFFFNFKLIYFYVHGSSDWVYVSAPHVCNAKEDRRGYQIPKDWRNSQSSQHVGAGRRTWVFWKSSQCS